MGREKKKSTDGDVSLLNKAPGKQFLFCWKMFLRKFYQPCFSKMTNAIRTGNCTGGSPPVPSCALAVGGTVCVQARTINLENSLMTENNRQLLDVCA